jgi:ribose transport system ATP-binding protein
VSSSNFLSARGLRKSFGQVEVLHGVDLDLAPGTVTALLGENGAGKSTLVRIIAGDYHADGGEIRLDGSLERYSVVGARKRGIRLISQEISDAPTMTVAENVVLGDWPVKGFMIDRTLVRREATIALSSLGANLDADALQSSLRLGERQLVEVARAIRGRSRLVIFDEPTAALSDAEARQLYSVIASLTEQGVAVLYITHRLDEVFSIADRVCVLRDGVMALVADVKTTNAAQVIEAMVGRAVTRTRSANRNLDDRPVSFELRGASGKGFERVDVSARSGEIIGIYGKMGSGVSEVAEAMFGIRGIAAGELLLKGVRQEISSPSEAIAAGIGYLPADRAREGAFQILSLGENLTAPSWGRLSRWHILMNKAIEASAYLRWHRVLAVRSSGDSRQKLATLSGGNQQKVLLGRWLEASSQVLVLAEPTRGVDVGAREEIYAVLRSLAERGTTIIVASSDYEDIIGVADKAFVMVRGQVVGQIAHEEITVSALTETAGGIKHG